MDTNHISGTAEATVIKFLPARCYASAGISRHRVSVSVCVTRRYYIIDEPCTLPLSPPKGGTKRNFAVFSSKIQLLSKKSATNFLCVKTSSGKVVATSFSYLTIVDGLRATFPST